MYMMDNVSILSRSYPHYPPVSRTCEPFLDLSLTLGNIRDEITGSTFAVKHFVSGGCVSLETAVTLKYLSCLKIL